MIARRAGAILIVALAVGASLWLHGYSPYAYSYAVAPDTAGMTPGQALYAQVSEHGHVSVYRRRPWETPTEGAIVVLGLGFAALLALPQRRSRPSPPEGRRGDKDGHGGALI